MKQLGHMVFVALKDLKLFAKDRGALFFFILFPLLFITMFSLMGGASEDPRLSYHLVTQESEGSLSYQILSSMQTEDVSQLKPGDPEITWLKDYDEARQAVEDKELSGFIAFPANFTEGLMTGSGAQLEVVVDTEDFDERAALNGMAHAIASQVGSHYVVVSATIELLMAEGIIVPGDTTEIERIIQQFFLEQGSIAEGEVFIESKVEKVGEIEAENPVNWTLTGYLVMFVFFGAALAAEAIVRERQNHTLERLLTGSIRRESILGGIFLGTAAKGIIQVLIFWTVGIFAFNADLGLSPLAVIILSILMVIMSSAFGIMLATLVKTQRAAGSIAVLASLVLAPLGGSWWPLFILPRWMQALAKVTPHGWANTGFNKLILFGADFQHVVPEMLVLLAFAVLFSTIAIYRFRAQPV